MQQPSSLIFLAIVVIWAAYLLQHWIRRREALATARSVDQFSDAMRVLERREHRVDDIAEQASDSPQVSMSGPRPSLRAGTVMTGENQQPATHPSADETGEAPASIAQKLAAAGNSSAGAMHRVGDFAAHAGSAKLRAIALVASLSLLIIAVVCTPFGALPWWSPILMLAISGGVLWWCRVSTVAASAHRAAAEPARRPEANAPKGRTQLPARKPAPAAVPLAKATMPEPTVQHAPVAASDHVFDVTASDRPATRQPVVPPVTQLHVERETHRQESSGEWQPVAVPRPTYTMKERAPERPQQAPAATTNTRSYDDVPNEDLPFDGLALDQDLDDLPSVFRAG